MMIISNDATSGSFFDLCCASVDAFTLFPLDVKGADESTCLTETSQLPMGWLNFNSLLLNKLYMMVAEEVFHLARGRSNK